MEYKRLCWSLFFYSTLLTSPLTRSINNLKLPILQVFKLKGADRKHKQDREKIQKRSPAEQKKFAKQSDKTLLAEIPLENVFANQVSRPDSPKQDVVVNFTCGGSVEILDSRPRCSSREESTATFFSASGGSGTDTSFGSREALHGSSQGTRSCKNFHVSVKKVSMLF